MIFRRSTLDSVFVSVIAAGALVVATTAATTTTTATSTITESDAMFTGSVAQGTGGGLLRSSNNRNTNSNILYVPRKIADNRHHGVSNGFNDVAKEGIELSIRLENNRGKEKSTATGTTRRLLRNNNSIDDDSDGDGDGDVDKPVNHNNTIDLGILVNAVPANTNGELGLDRELADSDDYCDLLCSSPRKKIYSNDLKTLVTYCETNDCGDCSGDGDNIDYRCPSQIKCWDTSSVTSMRTAFSKNKEFNEPLRCWDVSSVTNMSKMFYEAEAFNQPIDNWDVSSASNTKQMFHYATAFNQDLDSWDVSSVTTMEQMFGLAYAFNGDIGSWDVSSVTNMHSMFAMAFDFDQYIGNWDVSSVTNMESMFGIIKGSKSNISGNEGWKFNQFIGNWNVSSVKNMMRLFAGVSSFNQPLQSWDVSSVWHTEEMFYKATSFNQPLDVWDVPIFFSQMFTGASAFNQCLSSWSAKGLSFGSQFQNYIDDMFTGTSCPEVPESTSNKIQPFCQGSNEQCIATTCKDDKDFRFEGQDSKDCEWVALGGLTENRCAEEGVFEGCAKTCNPVCFGGCIDDTNFQLNGVKSKNCVWVANQKTDERCKKPGVLDACPATCNPSCAAAAVDCTDNPSFLLNGVKGKSCEWVAKKTDERCMKNGVMASCRQTCNPTCGCRDSTDKFEFQGSQITCNDLDIIHCDTVITSSDEFLAQIQTMLDEALLPIHEELDGIHQQLDGIEALIQETEATGGGGSKDPVLSGVKTYADLCPGRCQKCSS